MKRILLVILAGCLLLPSTAMAFREEGGESVGGGTTVPVTEMEAPETTGMPFEGDKVEKGALLNVKDVKGNYKKGSVYGPKLSTKELAAVKKAVIEAVNSCIRENMTDGQKIVALVNYLCDKVSYADDWSKNRANTAWGALVYGEAQCSGYARAMIALLDAVEIEAKYVHASKKAINPSHQWVLVKYGKAWYHLDPQGIDDYMVINTSTGKVTYPRPIVLMSSYMPYEAKNLPKTGSKDITLQ